MLLYVDEAIGGTPSLFAGLGTVRTFAGRSLCPGDLAEADALVVRSVTRVDERLLKDSRVQFVGTASSGTNHVDLDYLAARGISFADAAGCNSRTVAEYVLAVLLLLAERGGFELAGKVLGVVGVGRIGSIVADWGRSLGMRVLLCDPPLERAGVGGPYVSAARLAAESDVISLHVPLVRDGLDVTVGMVNEGWLSRVKNGAILINTSRGEVASEDALFEATARGRLGPIVIDVWKNEPNINPRLVKAAAVATPHVAGYSAEARMRAAEMIRERMAEFFGVNLVGEDREVNSHRLIAGATTAEWVLEATRIAETDRALREWIEGGAAVGGFDALRSRFTARREFSAYSIGRPSTDEKTRNLLRKWGFHLL